jgi:hypothetical protein
VIPALQQRWGHLRKDGYRSIPTSQLEASSRQFRKASSHFVTFLSHPLRMFTSLVGSTNANRELSCCLMKNLEFMLHFWSMAGNELVSS